MTKRREEKKQAATGRSKVARGRKQAPVQKDKTPRGDRREARPRKRGAKQAPLVRALDQRQDRGLEELACDIEALTPLVDPLALEMEAGHPLIWDDTDPALRPAANQLCALIEADGGTASISSAFRPQAYQDHLRQVWDRAKELDANDQPGCLDLRLEVARELGKHALSTSRLVGKTSRHTQGRAVDISWRLPDAEDASARVAELAAEAGLTHPFPAQDPPHFELA